MKLRSLGRGLGMAGLMAGLLLTSGCMDVKPLQRQILVDQTEADKALKEITPVPRKRSALMIDERPWFGAQAVPLENGETLPPALMRQDSLVLTFEKPMTLRDVGRMIQAATGMRVLVKDPMASETGSGQQSSVRTFLPAEGVEVAGGRVIWQGRLKDLLDQVSDAFDADWNYDGQSLTLSQDITRTFMLHALAGNLKMNSSLKSETGSGEEGGGGSLPDIGFSTDASLEIWDEISKTLEGMIKEKGQVTISPSTGTITVSGAPSLVTRAETYLREQNRLRLRRIAVAVKVLALQTSDVNDVTFRLGAILKRAFDGKPFQFTATDSGLTAGVLRSMPTADNVTGAISQDTLSAGARTVPSTDTITSILEATEEIDRVSVTQSGAVVTLSDIPAPLQIGTQISYLKEASREEDENGNVTVSLQAGQVNTGLTMNVLPRIVEKDKVLLRLAIGVKEASEPFQTFGTSELEIQLPEIQSIGFMQNAVLESGQTLILAGFEKNQTGINDEGTPGGLWTGGTRRLNKSREVNVLLITAEVLPEEPLTVLDR